MNKRIPSILMIALSPVLFSACSSNTTIAKLPRGYEATTYGASLAQIQRETEHNAQARCKKMNLQFVQCGEHNTYTGPKTGSSAVLETLTSAASTLSAGILSRDKSSDNKQVLIFDCVAPGEKPKCPQTTKTDVKKHGKKHKKA